MANKTFEELRKACWKGYKAIGLKKKGDRMVPNCVPEETVMHEVLGRDNEVGRPEYTKKLMALTPGQTALKLTPDFSYNKDIKKAPEPHPMKESGGAIVYKSGADHIEKYADDSYAVYKNGTKKTFYTSLEAAKQALTEAPAWRTKEGKSPTGGLNAKGIASYRRENPGSKLSMAVTTPPSKLKPGSKAANRRKSFCARMSGVEGPMKKPNGEPTRKALALRKWNCQN